MDKFKRGTARYLDEEFISKMTGWQKWVFGAGSAMYLENLTATIERLKNNEIVKDLGILDDSGNVNVEKMHRYLLEQARKGPVTFTIPMIGAVTLSEADVEKLYTLIMQA
jgi:hypothetical protein